MITCWWWCETFQSVASVIPWMCMLLLDLMQAKKKPETVPSGMYLSHARCFFLFACKASSARTGADGSLPSVFPVSTSPPIHSGPKLMFYKCSPDHVTLLLETSHRFLVSEKKNRIPCRSLPSSLIPSAPTASRLCSDLVTAAALLAWLFCCPPVPPMRQAAPTSGCELLWVSA